jgi:hypothetical protein
VLGRNYQLSIDATSTCADANNKAFVAVDQIVIKEKIGDNLEEICKDIRITEFPTEFTTEVTTELSTMVTDESTSESTTDSSMMFNIIFLFHLYDRIFYRYIIFIDFNTSYFFQIRIYFCENYKDYFL